MTSSGGMGLGRGNVFLAYYVTLVGAKGSLSMHPDEKHALNIAFQLMLIHLDELIDAGAPKDLSDRHSYTRVYNGKKSK